MSSAALALVLAAALLHATWNLAAKGVIGDRVGFVWLYLCVSVALWLPVGLVWAVATGARPSWVWLWGAAVSGALHVVYQLVLQRGYAEGDLNLVYPLARGSGPLLTFGFATFVLGQHVAPVAAAGILAIAAGVVLISLGRGGAHLRAGIWWGLATGATIASYTLWDDHSVNGLVLPPLPYFVLNLVLQVPLMLVLLGRRADPVPLRELWHATRRPVLVVGVCSPLAYVLVLRAMQLAPVSLVAAGREASIVVGAVFGWLVLREQRPVRRLVGAAVVLAGIVLLAVG